MIKIMTPVYSKYPGLTKRDEEYLRSHLPKETEFSFETLDEGYETVETEIQAKVNGEILLKKLQKGIEPGTEGIIIDCFDDPGLEEIRKITDIPVLGSGRTSLYFASILADRAGVITTDENGVDTLQKQIYKYGLEKRIVSIYPVDTDVKGIIEDDGILPQMLFETALKMIEKDDVKAICLGCTCYNYLADDLKNKLKEAGKNVAVIEPMLNTFLCMNAILRGEVL